MLLLVNARSKQNAPQALTITDPHASRGSMIDSTTVTAVDAAHSSRSPLRTAGAASTIAASAGLPS